MKRALQSYGLEAATFLDAFHKKDLDWAALKRTGFLPPYAEVKDSEDKLYKYTPG